MTTSFISETAPDKKARYTIDMSAAARATLSDISKRFKLTQGEVLEVLLDQTGNIDIDLEIEIALVAKREQKVAERTPVKELQKQLKGMTRAQLEAALKAATEVKS